ncbi:MAG: ATP-grasp domain-containing protein [Clostridiales bacterium]|nr:ATP-grasp domain-containing protein [Clostridiales bacterium]
MNIMIVYGGKSCEHDISIITACLAKGYFRGNIYSVYLDKNNRAYLAGNDWTPRDHVTKKLTKPVTFVLGEGKIAIRKNRLSVEQVPIDVVINCCHGLNGEDGCVAALCQLTGIPLVGSDIASSAVAMDKVLTKRVLKDINMPVVNGVEVTKSDVKQFMKDCGGLNFPIIVKPSMLGSSIGVEVAHDADELSNAINHALRYDDKLLCEEALTDFIELNCSALKANGVILTSVVDTPVTVHDVLTFADKYLASDSQVKPVVVDDDIKNQVKKITSQIYSKLNFGGVIRVDFLYDNKTGKLYVNEINTTPGSLAYGLWELTYSRTHYGEALVEQAIADYREMQQHVFTFESGVLDGLNGSKKK